MELICDPSGLYETPQQTSLANPASWLVDALTYSRESDTGITITWKAVAGLSASYYCVNTISGVIGQSPMCLKERKPDRTSEEDYSHPAGKLMRNPLAGPIGAFHFRSLMQNHALLQGNGRAFIQRTGRSEPMAFIPLPAERTATVTIYSEETQVRQKWHVIFPDAGEPIPLPDEDVLHIYRFSWDGYNGVPVLELLRNPLGLGIATEKSAARFHKQGGVPSFVLQAPPGVFRKQAEAEEFLRKFNEFHAGLDNAQRAGMLREGIEAKVLGINNRDAQMLEQRDFSVRDIMRIFGLRTIPGIETTQAGYNGLEQLNRADLIHCFGPWMKIWAEECARKLLTQAELRAERYYFDFDTWELVKPDASQEADMLTKYVSGMIIEPNEAREVIGYGPHEDGSGLKNPNITAGGSAGQQPPTTQQPPAEQPPTDRQRELGLIAAKLRPLVSAEIRRVQEMSVKARNFIDWTESFYQKHAERFSTAITTAGGEAWMAGEYIEHSKYQLLEAAGGCQKDQLAERIEQVTTTWMDRVDDLVATIAGVEA